MRKTKNFNISVPELGDRPDITQVSNAIQDLEDALAGTVEMFDGNVQGNTLTLTSPSRTTQRTKYYNGFTCQWVAKAPYNANTITNVNVDGLGNQAVTIGFNIRQGDAIQLKHNGMRFEVVTLNIPRSNAIDSSSDFTIATSLAVKTVNDKITKTNNDKLDKGGYTGSAQNLKNDIDEKANKSVQIQAGNGLTGGGDLTTNRALNVVSANSGIRVNTDNIELMTLDSVSSTDKVRPASANAVKSAYDNANGRVSKAGDTMTGVLYVPYGAGLKCTFGGDYDNGISAGISNETGYAMLWRLNNNPDKSNEFIGIDRNSNFIFRRALGGGKTKYEDCIVFNTHRPPTPSEVGALPSSGKAVDSSKLNGIVNSTEADGNTIVQRNPYSDIDVRTVKTTLINENYIEGAIVFRKNNADDNFLRYCNNTNAIREWIGVYSKEETNSKYSRYYANNNSNSIGDTDSVVDNLLTPGIYRCGANNGKYHLNIIIVDEVFPGHIQQTRFVFGGVLQYRSAFNKNFSGVAWNIYYTTNNKPTASDVGAVENIRLGTRAEIVVYGSTASDTERAGHVTTAVRETTNDGIIDTEYRRPIQYLKKGQWITVSMV